MRKLLLTVFMLFVMSTSCLAAADWQWICSDANMGFFFDKNTITFVKQKQVVNRDKVYVWIKVIYDEAYARKLGGADVRYTISKAYIDFASNKMGSDKVFLYNEDGRVITTLPPVKPEDIIPGSNGERIAKAVDDYIRTRTEEIEQRTRNAH